MRRNFRIRYGIRALLLVMFIAALVAWYFRTRYLDASHFPMAIGDRWVYASGVESTGDVIFEVVDTDRIEGAECFVVKRTIGKHKINFYISVQQDGVRLHRVGDDVYRPPYRQFAFRTKAADAWDWIGTIGAKPAKYNCINSGLDDVSVPYGSHKAFVISQGTPSEGWANFWLAPGVGVVKVDGKFVDQHDPQATLGEWRQFNWQLKLFTRDGRKQQP